MAARAMSSGTISFGLVSIPVKLYTVASSQSVRFNMLNPETGNRVKQQLVDAETGDGTEASAREYNAGEGIHHVSVIGYHEMVSTDVHRRSGEGSLELTLVSGPGKYLKRVVVDGLQIAHPGISLFPFGLRVADNRCGPFREPGRFPGPDTDGHLLFFGKIPDVLAGLHRLVPQIAPGPGLTPILNVEGFGVGIGRERDLDPGVRDTGTGFGSPSLRPGGQWNEEEAEKEKAEDPV